MQQGRVAQHERVGGSIGCCPRPCQQLLLQPRQAWVKRHCRGRAVAAVRLRRCLADVFQEAIDCLVGREDDEIKLEALQGMGTWQESLSRNKHCSTVAMGRTPRLCL
jgi:hypothetical protein